MVAATLASLSLNGRMAEISKRDIWSPQRVAQERPDIVYKLIAIDFLPPQVSLQSPFFFVPLLVLYTILYVCRSCHQSIVDNKCIPVHDEHSAGRSCIGPR